MQFIGERENKREDSSQQPKQRNKQIQQNWAELILKKQSDYQQYIRANVSEKSFLDPNVYCSYANYAEARWCGKCGSKNPYCRMPYFPPAIFHPPGCRPGVQRHGSRQQVLA